MLIYPAQDVRHVQKRSYPHLVIRLGPAVYQREEITISEGSPSVRVAWRNTQLCHQAPYDSNGEITASAKTALTEGVLAAVRTTNFRMCIVWSERACTFLERDGRIEHKNEPPSGGYGTGGAGGQPLPLEIAFDRQPLSAAPPPGQGASKDVV